MAAAIIALLIVAATTVFGLRPTRTHAAALDLEAALVEARGLARASADATDRAYPTGATVVVEAVAGEPGFSQIAVYRSRPIALGGVSPFAPVADVGFPARRVRGSIAVADGAGRSIAEPLLIMLSASGYASIAHLNVPYDARNPAILTSDPGCPSNATRIDVNDGERIESHPFDCAGATYAAN